MTSEALYHTDFELPPGAYFDEEKAQEAVDLIQQLQHGQDVWASVPFTLLDWELEIVRRVYGTRNEAGNRLYRRVAVFVGSGNGKTELAAAIIFVELLKAGPFAELYGIAKDSKQAARVFTRLKGILNQNFSLRTGFDILKQPNRVINAGTEATFTIASKDVDQLLGSAPSFVFVDEAATVNREIFEQVNIMMGKRPDSLLLMTTTASSGDVSRHSIAYESWDLIRRISEGEQQTDPTFLGYVWAAPPDAEWDDENAWISANPSLGTTLDIETLRNECAAAKATPSKRLPFCVFRLNWWMDEVADGLISMPAWDSSGTLWEPSELFGEACYGGLDISSRTDLTAFVLVFARPDESVRVLPWFFLPEEGLHERSQTDRIPYNMWRDQGFLVTVPGSTIDQRFIKQFIKDRAAEFQIADIGFDPWSARQLATELEEERITMVEVRQGFASLSEPTKELQRLVVDGKLDHGSNPILRSHAAAAIAKVDEAGNLKPDKRRSATKIDGIAATVIALDGLMRRGKKKMSVYDKRLLEQASKVSA